MPATDILKSSLYNKSGVKWMQYKELKSYWSWIAPFKVAFILKWVSVKLCLIKDKFSINGNRGGRLDFLR